MGAKGRGSSGLHNAQGASHQCCDGVVLRVRCAGDRGFTGRGMGQAPGHAQGGRPGGYGVVALGYRDAPGHTGVALGAALVAGEDCWTGSLYRAWNRGVAANAGGQPAQGDAHSAPLLGGGPPRVWLHRFGGSDEKPVGWDDVVATRWLTTLLWISRGVELAQQCVLNDVVVEKLGDRNIIQSVDAAR
jgi:hypothetical protein